MMRKFEMECGIENSAFDHPGEELARILRKLADRVESWEGSISDDFHDLIMDANGNKVGTAVADGEE